MNQFCTHLIIALFILIPSLNLCGQQFVEVKENESFTTNLTSAKERNIWHDKFIISRYPESIQQYNKYLSELKSKNLTDELKAALPKDSLLRLCNLSNENIQFIKEEYFKKKGYFRFPIIGLDHEQVSTYLIWKNKGQNKKTFNRDDQSIEIEPYIIPAYHTLLSAFQNRESNEIIVSKRIRKKKNRKIDKMVWQRFKVKPIFEYGLSKEDEYSDLKELTRINVDNGKRKFIAIESKNGIHFEFSDTTINQLLPWRLLKTNLFIN